MDNLGAKQLLKNICSGCGNYREGSVFTCELQFYIIRRDFKKDTPIQKERHGRSFNEIIDSNGCCKYKSTEFQAKYFGANPNILNYEKLPGNVYCPECNRLLELYGKYICEECNQWIHDVCCYEHEKRVHNNIMGQRANDYEYPIGHYEHERFSETDHEVLMKNLLLATKLDNYE